MPIITTGSFAKDLLPGINEWFGARYNQLEKVYPQIFSTTESGRAFEEDVLTSGLGLAKQINEGNAVKYDSMNQGYTSRYNHIKYGNGFIITEEMIDDGQSNILAETRARSLAWSMLQSKEITGANILNNGFDSNFPGGDTLELFSLVHETRAANVANELTISADLSEASLEQAIIDMANFRDDRGLRMKAKPMKLILPRSLVFEAQRLLKSELRPGTADNDLNAVKDMGLLQSGAVVSDYLTDPDAWYILTDVPDGLKYFTRKSMTVVTDNDMDTSNAKFKATARYSFGWTDFRGIFGSAGA